MRTLKKMEARLKELEWEIEALKKLLASDKKKVKNG
jgi:hypothetical protein